MGDILSTVDMEPCWAATVAFDAPVGTDLDVLDPIDGAIGFAARNNSKPGRGSVEAWTIHARPAFSSAQRDAGSDRVSAQLLDELSAGLSEPLPAVTYVHAHFWPHCLVTRPAGEACLADRTRRLFLAGDWCIGPRIEAAWQSGRAAAEAVLETI
jgi:predicted NAD/FAD-dependent oxidoreductase